jgi:hypothetical protein
MHSHFLWNSPIQNWIIRHWSLIATPWITRKCTEKGNSLPYVAGLHHNVRCYVVSSILVILFVYNDFRTYFTNREFKLRIILQTANGRQRKILRYQAIRSKLITCCFKTEIHNYSLDARKKIWNKNVQRIFCQESSNLPFAILGNVKLKTP